MAILPYVDNSACYPTAIAYAITELGDIVVLADIKSRARHIVHAVAVTVCAASEVTYFSPDCYGGEIVTYESGLFIDGQLQKSGGLMAIRSA